MSLQIAEKRCHKPGSILHSLRHDFVLNVLWKSSPHTRDVLRSNGANDMLHHHRAAGPHFFSHAHGVQPPEELESANGTRGMGCVQRVVHTTPCCAAHLIHLKQIACHEVCADGGHFGSLGRDDALPADAPNRLVSTARIALDGNAEKLGRVERPAANATTTTPASCTTASGDASLPTHIFSATTFVPQPTAALTSGILTYSQILGSSSSPSVAASAV